MPISMKICRWSNGKLLSRMNVARISPTGNVMGLLVISAAVLFSGCGKSDSTENSTDGSSSVGKGSSPLNGDSEQHSSNIATIRAQSTQGEFVPLNPKEFRGFPYETASVWSFADGIWTCTGTPKGYITSIKTYENFTLRYECRFPPLAEGEDLAGFKGNTGCLLYIDGDDKIWPVCLEVQGKYAETGTIKANGDKSLTVEIEDHPEIRGLLLKPVGEWNQIEIVSDAGSLTVTLNGETVCRSQPTRIKLGRIGFQSELSPVEFRNLEIMVP